MTKALYFYRKIDFLDVHGNMLEEWLIGTQSLAFWVWELLFRLLSLQG